MRRLSKQTWLISCLLALCCVAAAGAAVVPLRRAHAHNDYEHQHPLFDALEQGFCSVEADVYLVNELVLVGHDRKDCRPERTLAALYLDPLAKRVREYGGVYPGVTNFTLWIDIKIDSAVTKNDPVKIQQESEKTCAAVCALLDGYASMLTEFSAHGIQTNAVTVIFTGSHPKRPVQQEHIRASYDSHLADGPADGKKFTLAISENWTHLFAWRGSGEMPVEQRVQLRKLVARAHSEGKGVRFWATPEYPSVWRELLDANVDWIGTDRLADLAEFLLTHRKDER